MPTAARQLSPVDSEGSAGSVIGSSGRIRLLNTAPGVLTADAAQTAAPDAAPDAVPDAAPGVLTADNLPDAVPDAVPEAAPPDAPAGAPPGAAPPRSALGAPAPSRAGPSRHCAAHESVQRWAYG